MNIKAFLSEMHPVSDRTLDTYISHWAEYMVPKKAIMTAPGDTERYIYFVKEGIQKSYYLIDDKQHVIAFAYAPSFSGIPESFFSQDPSKYLDKWRDMLPNANIKELDCGHFVQEEKAKESIFEIRAFMKLNKAFNSL